MGGISTGIGLFSGIDTQQLISQLISLESRPKILAQQRIVQLQGQQAAYLDLNSRISALKTAAASFRVNRIFQSHAAASSNPDVLTASASTSALPGSYSFIVDRMVSSQQMLSRGFASATAGLNAGSFTFESAVARLDRDTPLADLNGGAGIQRGKIIINDASGASATVDLSRVATVNEVLDAINSATDVDVTASVEDGRFIVRSNNSHNISITSATGFTTAETLGIHRAAASSTAITGSTVHALGQDTGVRALNDGNGIYLSPASGSGRYDFRILVKDLNGNTDTVLVNIGDKYDAEEVLVEPAPTTLSGIIARINDKLLEIVGDNDIQASIAPDGVSLQILDSQNRTIEVLEHTGGRSTAAADLGLKTTDPQVGSVQGRRILAGLNSTLASLLNGGSGIAGDGAISITARDGTQHTININTNGSVSQIIAAITDHASGKFKASLSHTGTGILLTDLTGGTGNLIIEGETAQSLGIATDPAGIAENTAGGENLQRKYLTKGTLLSTLRNGQGIGTGRFRIIDSSGLAAEVNITSSHRTVDDVMHQINSAGTLIRARINANGDGIELYDTNEDPGALKIKVEDSAGVVATHLNLVGESGSGEPGENVIDGSFERKLTFDPNDTLEDIVRKINSGGVGVAASIINDGSGTNPYRLSLTSRHSGETGRFIIDTGGEPGFNLGLSQLEAGENARVFFGSSDPARAVLLTSSSNTLDSVATGVTIDLKQTNPSPVVVTITRDTAAIESAINGFIEAFNAVTSRIAHQTRFDQETNARGPLLGDGTAMTARTTLFSVIQGRALNVASNFDRLADVGITVGTGGQLQLNRDRFRQALEQDPQGVAELFTARVQDPPRQIEIGEPGSGVFVPDPDQTPRFSSLGFGSLVENLADSFINSLTGSLTRKSRSITDQIALQNRRIADIDARLASRRTILERQFLAMERAIGQLQSQQMSIGQISQMR